MIPDNTVVVCRGKSCCKKESCAFSSLCEMLDAAGVLVETVECLGICDGPTAGVCVKGRVEWFRRLAKESAQRDLVGVAAGTSPLTGRLEKRRLTGSKRGKATKKARRQLLAS